MGSGPRSTGSARSLLWFPSDIQRQRGDPGSRRWTHGQALGTGVARLNDECILERPDGSRVAVLVNVVPHKDEHGRVTGAVSCMLDITERRRIEGLAKARERETKAVVDNSPDPIVRYSRESVRTYVNPAFVRVHGAPQEALLGKKIGSPEPAALEASEHLQTSLQSVLATGRPLEIEVIWPSPAGPRCYAVHLEPELDSRGQPESVLCISRNITERKRAEEALRESQRLLQQVLATLPVGVIVTARNGDIIFVNTASKRIWGGETIAEGRERWDRSVGYWHETGNKIEAADWASVRALNNGQTSLNELIDIESYNGQQKTILNSAAPIRNAGDKSRAPSSSTRMSRSERNGTTNCAKPRPSWPGWRA